MFLGKPIVKKDLSNKIMKLRRSNNDTIFFEFTVRHCCNPFLGLAVIRICYFGLLRFNKNLSVLK